MKYVTYDGSASGYMLILTDQPIIQSTTGGMKIGGIGPSTERIVAALYLQKGQIVAMQDSDFMILQSQGHIGSGKLKEFPAPPSVVTGVVPGMMLGKCPKCGATNPPSNKYCSNCGNKL